MKKARNKLVKKFVDWAFPEVKTESETHSYRAERVGGGTYRVIGSVGWTGEKNFGELGPIKDYYLDYASLRERSWQLYLESEIAQTIINKFTTWVIGNGLKLESEPIKDIIEDADIKFDAPVFSKKIEARFTAYCKSRSSDYSNMNNLNMLAIEAFKNTIIGGDVLVILRYIDGAVKIQLIDGVHVQSPQLGSELYPMQLGNNTVANGIEMAPNGEHVAYHVRKPGGLGMSFETERIPARGKKSGVLQAFMVYGGKHRIDNNRGVPLLSVLFETTKKLERYKEAMVGSAEERAKIVYAIEHKEFSTGETPFLNQTVKAMNYDGSASDDLPQDEYGEQLANKMQVTMNKQAVNMPVGSSMNALDSKIELHFKDFYETNIVLYCGAAQMPYEVALSKYDSNYSASRAAIKDWENTLLVRRGLFGQQFYKPIYEFFVEVGVMSGEININGYVAARIARNHILLEAFLNARFVGPPVPHIDPEKEVKAERLKLGSAAGSIPLTTVERATEALGGGDALSNIEQFAMEMDASKKLGIKPEEKPQAKPQETKPGK